MMYLEVWTNINLILEIKVICINVSAVYLTVAITNVKSTYFPTNVLYIWKVDKFSYKRNLCIRKVNMFPNKHKLLKIGQKIKFRWPVLTPAYPQYTMFIPCMPGILKTFDLWSNYGATPLVIYFKTNVLK